MLRDQLDLDDSFEADIERALADGVVTTGAVRRIGLRLADLLPGLDRAPLEAFPHLARAGEVESRRKETGLALLPASAFALVERSRGVAGILHELEQLADSRGTWSLPLQCFLAERKQDVEEGARDVSQVPAILSGAQERIVRSARKNALTLCHGPPGTGKSFTIAAIAIDHIARGHSVLIASEKDHAVDVAWEKIRGMMGGVEVAVRAGRSGYLRKLKTFVQDCLSGMHGAHAPSRRTWEDTSKELKRTLRELRRREERLAGEVEETLAHGELIADPKPSWWRWFRQGRVKARVARRPLMMEMSAELERTHARRIRIARKLLKMRRAILLRDAVEHAGVRAHLRTFLSGLRKRKPGDQEKMLRQVNWSTLLTTLPVWLVRLSDVHRVLPLERNVFDVAIIDEATQCDLASVLPVLQRARRVVVAGDQRQLRHVSFVSRRRMTALAKSHRVGVRAREGYDYRERSLMDVAIDRAMDARQIGFLNEHFRSRKPIIAFSNERFYSGRIVLMTDRPWESDAGALEVEECGGTRDRDGVNAVEIDCLIAHLREFLTESPGGPPRLPCSIGILSPFRNQVEAIGQRLGNELPGRLHRELTHKHRLLLGTAHSFQGEERDIMLLSFAVDAETPANVLRFLERPDVFNVSITRARSRQHIFTSVSAAQLPQRGLLASYLSFAQSGTPPRVPGSHIPDAFADELELGLRNHKCDVRRSVAVAGVPVDLLVLRNGRAVGIDLVGHPGEMRGAIEEERIRILARAGFALLPLGSRRVADAQGGCPSRGFAVSVA